MWPFTRKPKPINPGPINEDWRVGDLAEMIGPHDDWQGAAGPARGDVLKVARICAGRGSFDDVPAWFLSFAPWGDTGFDAVAFRKVPPLNSEASAEFTAQIRKMAHRKAPAA